MDYSELIVSMKKGDREAYKIFFIKYSGKILNICYGFCNQKEDSEDIMQEVFIEVYRSIKNFRGESSLETWLYRISIRKSLDFIRKRKSQKRNGILARFFGESTNDEVTITDNSIPQDEEFDRNNRLLVFEKMIQRLPSNQKIALNLHIKGELTNAQISKIMSKNIPSVDSLLHRAKENLKRMLNNYYKNIF